MKVLSEREFRDKAKAGTPIDAGMRKSFVAEIKAPADATRTIDFVISTASVDRMGDTIAVDGWQLANYRKNPVVLWAHDPSMLPVAKASNIRVEDGKLKATAEFMPREISGFSDAVFQAIKSGFLNAVSVGFDPIKYAFSEDNSRSMGVDFLQQELLEFSVVPIPANAEALVEARAAGIDVGPIQEWAEGIIKGLGLATIEAERLKSILGLPEEFRAAAKKIPDSAKGARGQLLRCANMAERVIKSASADWRMGAAKSLPIDQSDAWDGGAASKRMLDACGFDGENPDAAGAKRGFLAYDAANPSLRGSYKLPFCDVMGGELKAVAGGIRAAASRLPQTDIPDSVKAEARAVLDDYETRMGSKATPRLDMARRRLALLDI